MDDAMNKLIREQMRVIIDEAGYEMNTDQVTERVESLELGKTENEALYYAAGYLRACAELANVTVSELLENI